MKNWKIKLAEVIEAVIFIVVAIILAYVVITKTGVAGVVLTIIAVLSGLAFHVTRNIEKGLTPITGKVRNEIPVSEKVEAAKVAKAEQTSTDSTKKNK